LFLAVFLDRAELSHAKRAVTVVATKPGLR
jgi:hypothetical protein